jgi:hypothetical protein
MRPPPGEALWTGAEVESERRVAGDVFLRNGQTERDWRRRASMVIL